MYMVRICVVIHTFVPAAPQTQKLRSFCGLFFELLGLGFSGLAWRGNLWSFRSLFWVKKMVAQRFRAEMEIG